MTGYTQAYPFVPAADDLSIKPSRDTEILQTLLDSGFIGEEWRVRTDATHGKSKSYRRCEVLGGRFMATPANAQFIAGVSGREVHSTKWSGEISAKIGTVMDWRPRLAQESDVPGLEALIPASARALLATHYSPAQIEAALGPIFGVDQQLIRDGTYFVSERDGVIVGCGGWSRRRSLYGGDSGRGQEDALLDPQRDAARVRAFFVHPSWARRGIGRSIMKACEQAIIEAGFPMVEIVATLAGEPLYAAFGYAVVERYEIVMAGGLGLPVVRMAKTLKG
jgi:GNAT superfamily N-acetyltransferase